MFSDLILADRASKYEVFYHKKDIALYICSLYSHIALHSAFYAAKVQASSHAAATSRPFKGHNFHVFPLPPHTYCRSLHSGALKPAWQPRSFSAFWYIWEYLFQWQNKNHRFSCVFIKRRDRNLAIAVSPGRI